MPLQDAELKQQSSAEAPPDQEHTSSSDLEHVEAADAQESNADGSDSDNDFDKYLNDIDSGSDEEEGKPSKPDGTSDNEESGSGEDLDLDDYMRVLADEGKKA